MEILRQQKYWYNQNTKNQNLDITEIEKIRIVEIKIWNDENLETILIPTGTIKILENKISIIKNFDIIEILSKSELLKVKIWHNQNTKLRQLQHQNNQNVKKQKSDS